MTHSHGEPTMETPSETLWGTPDGRFMDHACERPSGRKDGLRTALSGSDGVSAGRDGCGDCDGRCHRDR